MRTVSNLTLLTGRESNTVRRLTRPDAPTRATHALRRTATAFALVTAFVAIGALSACVKPRASSTAFRTLPPKASVQEVEVFTDGRPTRPYEELGFIEVRKFGRADYGQLITRAREEAAKMGADAILVTRENRTVSTNTTGTVNPPTRRGGRTVTTSSSTLEEPRVTVTAITWSKP